MKEGEKVEEGARKKLGMEKKGWRGTSSLAETISGRSHPGRYKEQGTWGIGAKTGEKGDSS